MSESPKTGSVAVERICVGLTTSRGFYILISALVVLYFIFRGLLYPAAPSDDAEQLLFSQVFRRGYDVVNPPLYTWLVIGVQQLVGVEVFSVSLVKFPAYWLIFHFMYLSACRVLSDKRLAILAALSPLWLYYVAWDSVMSYSHSVLATALILATLHGMLRLYEKPDFSSYVILGLLIGLGVMSKYTFGLFTLALLIAGVAYRPFRSIILNPRILVTLGIAALIASPHITWLIGQSDMISGAVSGKFEVGGDGDFFAPRLKGLLSSFTSGLGFVSPLWLLLLVIFWRPFRERLKVHEIIPPTAKFLAIYMIVVAVVICAMVLLFGVSKVRAHYMFVFIPFPLVFFAWLEPVLQDWRPVRMYTLSLAFISAFLVTGVVVKWVSEPLRCKRCQLMVPYDDIGQKIRETGFKGGTIFAYYFPHDLPGNLRVEFPNTRIVSTKYPHITRPVGETPGQCLILWVPLPIGVKDARGMTLHSNDLMGTALSLKGPFPEKPLNFTFERSNGRTSKIHYMLYDPGIGECR